MKNKKKFRKKETEKEESEQRKFTCQSRCRDANNDYGQKYILFEGDIYTR